MPVHPPPFGDVVASLVYLVIIIATVRFALRWFLGVRALQRKCERQAWLLEVMARRLEVELPTEPPRRTVLEGARRFATRVRSHAAAFRGRLSSKVR